MSKRYLSIYSYTRVGARRIDISRLCLMGCINTHLAGTVPIGVERHPLEIIGERLPPRGPAFLPPPFSSLLRRPQSSLSPSFLRLALAQLFTRAARVFAQHWALHSAALLEGGLAGWCTRNAAEGGRRAPGMTEVGYQRRACSCNGHLGFDALARPGSVHARFCTNDSAGPAHEEYDLDPAARRCIAPSRWYREQNMSPLANLMHREFCRCCCYLHLLVSFIAISRMFRTFTINCTLRVQYN